MRALMVLMTSTLCAENPLFTPTRCQAGPTEYVGALALAALVGQGTLAFMDTLV